MPTTLEAMPPTVPPVSAPPVRMARCTHYGQPAKPRPYSGCSTCEHTPDLICRCERPSAAMGLWFFNDRSAGSRAATDFCVCGYALAAHDPERIAAPGATVRRLTVIERGLCTGFVACGPAEFDEFYCGCHGTD